MTLILLSALLVTAVLAACRAGALVRWSERLAGSDHALRRIGPWVAGTLSLIVVWYVWGELRPVAKVQDEMSYLLQAEIFTRGRWSAPSPPLPEFFEQAHVLVVPTVASKYPPGHALALALGSLVGFPAIMTLLMTGLTGALLFVLVARIADAWTALLAWVTWLTAPIVLRFQPGYYSEVTTALLLLCAWWLLLEWRSTLRTRWLMLMALSIGWGAITRPLTMLAFAIPIGVIVIRDCFRLRLWRDFGLAFATGILVLSLLPLWSARTTGDWRVSPVALYTRDYLPFDRMGFTTDTTAPRRALSPVVQGLYDSFLAIRKAQTIETIPETVSLRVVNLLAGFFREARLPLLLLAVIGLFGMPVAAAFAVLSAALLFLAHLPYAHWAPWAVYYLETTPVVALLIALGARRIATWRTPSVTSPRLAMLLLATIVVGLGVRPIEHWRHDHRFRGIIDRSFARSLETLPAPAIVFVRYSEREPYHVNLVRNEPDLAGAPYWVVHDLGPRNQQLIDLAPERKVYYFLEERMRIVSSTEIPGATPADQLRR